MVGKLKWGVKVRTDIAPWISFGIHLDFRHLHLDVHVLWWVIVIGNTVDPVYCGYCYTELPDEDALCPNCDDGIEFSREGLMDNEVLECWEQMRGAIIEFGQALVESVGLMIEAMTPAVNAIWEACREAYRAAGMPYGESDDGMMRWLREVGEIDRLRWEAERLEEHHRGMADFRRMVDGG